MMTRRGFVIGLYLLFCLLNARAQNTVSGKVTDARTGEPLAFVNIQVNDGQSGTVTDIDGRFRLLTGEDLRKIRFSYIGYEPLILDARTLQTGMKVSMKKTELELPEVTVYPGENPALRIIRLAMENRKRNNYENLSSFRYQAYEKTVFTINADSLLYRDTMSLDTSERNLRRFLEKRNFFMIENHYERSFRQPRQNLQKVTATRISGFRDPVFVFLLSQMQSTSFYDDVIRIGDKNYINPLTPGSLSRYFYQIEDTLVNGTDTVFSVFYRPWKGTRFDGLQGILNISTRGWGIASVTAAPFEEPKDIGIKIQQLYEADSQGIWFPRQLNTDLSLKTAAVTTSDGKKQYMIIATGRTYISQIEILPDLSSASFGHVEIDVDPNAPFRDDNYWKMVRIEPLDGKETETYRFIDSIGKKQNFDRLAYIMEAALNGKIPVGYLSLNLNKLLRYNAHEGFYTGAGLETNDRISRYWQAGGYWGYGFKDQTAKYGGFLKMVFNRAHDVEIRYAYRNDKIENGATEFPSRSRTLADPSTYRDLLVSRMDKIEEHSLTLSFRTLRYIQTWLEISDREKIPSFGYSFQKPGQPALNRFEMTEFSAAFRWVYKEKFIRNARSKVSLGSDYPVVWFKYSRGIDGLLGGQYAYDRLDLDISASLFTPFAGKTSLRLHAGMTSSGVPLGELYNARASFGRFTLFSPGSFSTMHMNEFYSDRYIAAFASHNFGPLLYKGKWFHPEIEIFSNALLGSLSHPEYHTGPVLKSPEKGYFESGLNLNNLLSMGFYNLGLGTAFRYGPYQLPKTTDNLTVMITLNWNLGK